jgi:Uma2 family endonuclease
MELVKGELLVSPSPRPRHNRVSRRLLRILEDYAAERGLGEVFYDTDTELGSMSIRCPDLLFVPEKRAAKLGDDDIITKADAELVVEIVSPGSVRIDREDKFAEYAKAGIRHYWIIDPREQTAEAFLLTRGAYKRVTSGRANEKFSAPPFKGLVIALERLWTRAPRK